MFIKESCFFLQKKFLLSIDNKILDFIIFIVYRPQNYKYSHFYCL